MYLKQSFSHSKWVLPVILSLFFETVFLPVHNLTLLFSLTVPNFVVFLRLLDRKFNEDSKNLIKRVIFPLQVGFIGNFVSDCSLKLCFYQFII